MSAQVKKKKKVKEAKNKVKEDKEKIKEDKEELKEDKEELKEAKGNKKKKNKKDKKDKTPNKGDCHATEPGQDAGWENGEGYSSHMWCSGGKISIEWFSDQECTVPADPAKYTSGLQGADSPHTNGNDVGPLGGNMFMCDAASCAEPYVIVNGHCTD